MAKQTKFTPGPWKVVNHSTVKDHRIVIRIETDKDSICEVHNLYRPESCIDGEVEKQNNARLIAAAPELLEVVELFIDSISGVGIEGNTIKIDDRRLQQLLHGFGLAKDVINKIKNHV